MKILHTSDWHIGQKFMGKSREDEHTAFLLWLFETIEIQDIDVLIVAGDIFDTGNPPNYALELYYNFLKRLFSIDGLYVIITAGNHDSISTLKAPKLLLEAMNVFVITSGDENENELISIYKEQQLTGVICAVPFLRDSVVRQSVSGQSISDKESSLNQGIKQHYIDVYDQAIKLTKKDNLPIIATGHLTTVGSRTSESERDIYIGGTIDIGSDFLGKYFDYVALGHLHINQTVGVDHVRYSGSPIPLSFSEANQKKKVNIITFEKSIATVEEFEIPLHKKLQVLKGNLESILKELEKIEDKTTWFEIHLNDKNAMSANQEIRDYAQKEELIILAIKISRRLQLEEIEDKEFINELNLNFKKVIEKVSL